MRAPSSFLHTLSCCLMILTLAVSLVWAQSDSDREQPEAPETPEQPETPGIQVEPSVEILDLNPDHYPEPDGYIPVTLNVTIPPNVSGGTLDVWLEEVTEYPGEYGNSVVDFTTPDMSLEKTDTVNIDWTLTDGKLTQKVSVSNNVAVSISCHDYAAAGVLKVKLTPSTGMVVTDSARVPRDDDNNGIADGWDNKWEDAMRAGNGDNETGPGNNPHNGDGFTYWEEYRGFDVAHDTKTKPIRLDPKKKDVFTYSEFLGESYWEAKVKTKGGSFDVTDIGHAKKLEQTNTFVIHICHKDFDTEEGWVNHRNPENKRRLEQYAIFVDEFTVHTTIDETKKWLTALGVPSNAEGLAWPRPGYDAPNAPAGMKSAIVFPVFYTLEDADGKMIGAEPHIQQAVDQIIAHEFAHIMFVDHHDIKADPGKKYYIMSPETGYIDWNNNLKFQDSFHSEHLERL